MPTTTNLSIVTPASSDYVTNGAVAMQTMADDIDGYWGALTAYTPTTTNVTGATTSGFYVRMGKLGFVFAQISAGTATANGSVSLSLPSGWTSTRVSPLDGQRGTVTTTAFATAGTTITCHKDSDGTNFTLGDTVSTYRVVGWLELT